MTVTKCLYCLQIKWIAKCMRDHHGLCLIRQCFFKPCDINIVLRNCHIYKHWNCTILDYWCYCCRKTCSNCDYLIASFYLSFSQ